MGTGKKSPRLAAFLLRFAYDSPDLKSSTLLNFCDVSSTFACVLCAGKSDS